jgi:hypothetical protein
MKSSDPPERRFESATQRFAPGSGKPEVVFYEVLDHFEVLPKWSSSASGSAQVHADAVYAGAAFVATKPFDDTAFADALARWAVTRSDNAHAGRRSSSTRPPTAAARSTFVLPAATGCIGILPRGAGRGAVDVRTGCW